MWYNVELRILDQEQWVTVLHGIALCAVVLGSIGGWRLGTWLLIAVLVAIGRW